MKMKVIDDVKNLLGSDETRDLGMFLESLSELAPGIGNLIQSHKIRRLQKRLSANEDQIRELRFKVSSIDDEHFVDLLKNFLFPSILEYILQEDEDNKIGYFLDGFGKVIDDKIINQSKILILYDILRNLRFVEIEYLTSLTYEYIDFNRKVNDGVENSSPFRKGDFLEIKYAVEANLEKMGLIKTSRNISSNDLKDALKRLSYNSSLQSKDRTEITKFGYNFLNTFSLLDKYKMN